MRAITTEALPILVWGDAVDDAALDQARNLANLPFGFHHVALMPDAHVGYGMPIGGVFAAIGQVVPHAVGLDIGCGVRAWNTGVTLTELLPYRDAVLDQISRSIPQGFNWHATSQAGRSDVFDDMPDVKILHSQMSKAQRQLGSLGGGNHFIELQADEGGRVWCMLHSGSRNVGKQVAEHFDRVARDVNREHGSPVPSGWGLAHLPVDSPEGRDYLAAMNWCLRFARESRRLMAEDVQAAIAGRFHAAEAEQTVDVHHNYAAIEEHYGETVVVHRKGAVRASGTVLVPGTMGTSSYMGDGLDSEVSFGSCSHGAGRAMGRRSAARSIARQDVMDDLESRGVRLLEGRTHDIAEEAPQAYKDIDEVMAWQRDLVAPTLQFRPVAVIKG